MKPQHSIDRKEKRREPFFKRSSVFSGSCWSLERPLNGSPLNGSWFRFHTCARSFPASRASQVHKETASHPCTRPPRRPRKATAKRCKRDWGPALSIQRRGGGRHTTVTKPGRGERAKRAPARGARCAQGKHKPAFTTIAAG